VRVVQIKCVLCKSSACCANQVRAVQINRVDNAAFSWRASLQQRQKQ
jgi:hypothetical protein